MYNSDINMSGDHSKHGN